MYKPEDLAAANKASVESALKLANVAFGGAERLAALNLNTARTVYEENVASVKAMLNVKNAEEFAKLQSELLKPVAEKALAYSRNAYEIYVDAAEEMAKLSQARYEAVKKEVEAVVEKAAQAAPAGSEPAIKALKTALAAANSAYDSVAKAAKQVAEIADKNVAAMNDAAVKAVAKTTAKPAPVAKAKKAA